ncbi:MAG: YbaB/EbfC family nucleoid-associated protein [Gordonia sp. (in: high G+C Gram-positive bacteria)]|uniref:YbaB/EbfC family nucleoid-associated protein n=1 Tax=Gordonia sp. (in: high G+C Gram-positive bacteria) TaxID=84139 RepID=UPI003BB5DDCB
MDQITADAAAHLAVLERLHRDLTGLSVTARADDGRIAVRVDATGALVGLRLLAGAGQGDASRLGHLIVAAAAAAARELYTRRADLTAEFLSEFGDTPDAAGTEDASGASNP